MVSDDKVLLDYLTTAVIQVSFEGRIYYANSQAEQLFHLTSEKLCRLNISDVIQEQADENIQLISAIEQRNPFIKREALWNILGATPYGSSNSIAKATKKIVEYTLTPVDDDTAIIEIRDLSRLSKISRDGAIQSVYELSQNLVRGLAHEIKNPLGGIRGSAQLLERLLGPTENGQELKEYTDIIIAETDRLKVLVDRMLGPKRQVYFEERNIHEVIDRVAQIISLEYESGIRVIRDYDVSIPELDCDDGMLVQSFLNIARNAAQALVGVSENLMDDLPSDRIKTDEKLADPTPKTTQPFIRFTTRIERNFTIGQQFHPLVIAVKVEDNGPGIPKDLIEEIFFPMISGRAEGTGLGLAIAQEIITTHKGTIEVQSAPGSTVSTTFLPFSKNTL